MADDDNDTNIKNNVIPTNTEGKLVHYTSDVPNFVGCEAFKGTNYGPAKYLSKRRKRFRLMNPEELKKYDAKVKASNGFDVDGCTGCLPGRIIPILNGGSEWEMAVSFAKFASEDCANHGGPTIKFASLEKANVRPCQGGMYFLTFMAEDVGDDEMKTYRAKVWWKACYGLNLTYFREFKNSKQKPTKTVVKTRKKRCDTYKRGQPQVEKTRKKRCETSKPHQQLEKTSRKSSDTPKPQQEAQDSKKKRCATSTPQQPLKKKKISRI